MKDQDTLILEQIYLESTRENLVDEEVTDELVTQALQARSGSTVADIRMHHSNRGWNYIGAGRFYSAAINKVLKRLESHGLVVKGKDQRRMLTAKRGGMGKAVRQATWSIKNAE